MSETTITRKPATPGVETITDSLGRVLKIQRLDAVAEMDLIEAAGTLAENRRWMMMATLAACVQDIDGHPVPPVSNRNTIRAVVRTVGSEGIAAVMNMLAPEEADAPAEATDAQDAAKN